MFIQCDDRGLVKRYLQLFIEKIVIKLPKVEIVAKPEVILAVLENKKAVRTDGVLTAVGDWLPLVDVLRHQFAGPSKEMMDTILVAQNQVKDGFLATGQL